MNMKLLLISTILLLTILGCSTDKERIRDLNEATGKTQVFDPDTVGGTIDTFDLRDGDCFNSASLAGLGEEFGIFEEVELVPCSGDWQFRILNSFLISDTKLPSDLGFLELGEAKCHRLYTFAFFPTSESWELGDRTFSCIQER